MFAKSKRMLIGLCRDKEKLGHFFLRLLIYKGLIVSFGHARIGTDLDLSSHVCRVVSGIFNPASNCRPNEE